MLGVGSHLISVNDVYGGTYRYFSKVASEKGVTVDFVEMSDVENISKYLKPETKVR